MKQIQYDDIGPSKVFQYYFPKIGIKAFLVVDNTALGASIGGIRISPDVTLQEVARLARAMTLKNAIAGLPHGGGKAGIVADPSDPNKNYYIRIFARAIAEVIEYIPGPDMGSNEDSMGIVHHEIGRAVGLPEVIGGIPLDKLGATGFGLAECAEIAAPYANIDLKNATVAVQGFGNVGRAAARFLSEKGAKIIGVSDIDDAVVCPNGFNVEELIEYGLEKKPLSNFSTGTAIPRDDLLNLKCDILIPAAGPDIIMMENVDKIQTRMLLCGANIPISRDAEQYLHSKGVLTVPDFIANAGGVIMGAMEFAKKSKEEGFGAISEKIKYNTQLIMESYRKDHTLPREAAEKIAKERVKQAMNYQEV